MASAVIIITRMPHLIIITSFLVGVDRTGVDHVAEWWWRKYGHHVARLGELGFHPRSELVERSELWSGSGLVNRLTP